MKKILILICLCSFSFLVNAQTTAKTKSTTTHSKTSTVEAACGSCQFGMKGKGCSLAVRIDGKPYWVDGAKLDSYGDAHAHDGMCNAIRKAEVSGEIKKGKYVAKTFKLLPAEKIN